MRSACLFEGQACFQEALRLAPELRLAAEAPERGEELRIAAPRREPAFGALDADARLLGARAELPVGGQLAVEVHELGGPFRAERALDDLARERRSAERGGVACGGAGDARMDLVARGDLAPAALEGAGVVSGAREKLHVGLHLVFLGERGRDGIALDELAGEAQHFVPGTGAALRAQQHARRG